MSPQHLPRATLQFSEYVSACPESHGAIDYNPQNILAGRSPPQVRGRGGVVTLEGSTLFLHLTSFSHRSRTASLWPTSAPSEAPRAGGRTNGLAEATLAASLSYSLQSIRGAQTHWHTALGTSRMTLFARKRTQQYRSRGTHNHYSETLVPLNTSN